MSGDVTLIDTSDGAVSWLVRMASTLFARPGFAPAALVGGLAVTMRLATVHRATNDIDTVTDGDGPRAFALEYLADADADTRDANRVEIGGVKVDVMPTFPLPEDADDLPDDELQRLFLLGHRWALESAHELSVHVVTASGPVIGDAPTLMVATAPALVACKFHALADRRDARSEKRQSDALDLVRLIADLVRAPAVTAQFSSAPFDLAALVSSQAQRWLIADATRMARLINLSDGVGGATMDPDDIATIGGLFVAMLDAR